MSRRVGALLAVALALVAIVVLSRRHGDATVARPSTMPETSRPVADEQPSRSAPATPVLPALPVAHDAVEVPAVDGVAFAQEYADALCACTEATCLDEVRRRYARRTGEAQPSDDARSLHEAFVRGQACIRAVRAAADTSG
jgi:hypothetical protein